MRILTVALPTDAPIWSWPAAVGSAMSGDHALTVLPATSVEQADGWMAAGPVDVIAASASSWAIAWVGALPPETRPALVLTGAPGDRALAEADEWISDGASPAEVAVRLQAAVRRARLRRRAIRRGNVDPLTGLPNRRGVMVALLRGAARSRRQSTRLSLVLIDLDHFKRINELQGHDAGDRVLRRVGRALRRATRQDEVCGRIGGDEFVVVVAGDSQHSELVARRIASTLVAEGVTATTAHGELGSSESLRELYRRVDAQLRSRKRAKRSAAMQSPSLGH
jgi:diguanylate cyclase (GGDEF)-like protein